MACEHALRLGHQPALAQLADDLVALNAHVRAAHGFSHRAHRQRLAVQNPIAILGPAAQRGHRRSDRPAALVASQDARLPLHQAVDVRALGAGRRDGRQLLATAVVDFEVCLEVCVAGKACPRQRAAAAAPAVCTVEEELDTDLAWGDGATDRARRAARLSRR